MRFMLDANTLIGLLSGHPSSLIARAAQCSADDLVTSAIAFAEVALGTWQGKRPSIIVLDRLGDRIPILPFDHLAGKYYAQLPFRRGSYDRLIAAHALSLGLTLITNNERDFADIPNLSVENWMS
ncbi:MAG: type II toxin-antitoxin system VapC family toxin [Sphingomonas sp.]|nr:type II toxin-antitoxin system VapC family toxin [Sphingomonas sp.]